VATESEAIEAILINGSRVEPKVAVLKPLSSAISIGSGGPFGAEGPIIMTGGAFGSLVAQFFHLTSAERKTLLVAGAAGGMAATFAAPVAAVLLAVELLLFEWKPRSLIPVALGCVLVGLLAGALSALLTGAVYACEDAFQHLPIHWMWWPAIGGLVIGIGGLVFPQALGVGYDTIDSLLQGNVAGTVILGILVVKSIIWAVSLGSGTSGGVLAPLLMMGGALGGLEAMVLPNEGAGFWPLISMGAILGGTMRSPFTGVIFALELTHDVNALLPLLVASILAHGFTVLVLRRSILTEKVARRGYHPLEILLVREVMRTNIVALPADISPSELGQRIHGTHNGRGQRLYPLVDADSQLVGVVTRNDIQSVIQDPPLNGNGHQLADLVHANPVVAYAEEPLRVVVYRMAETGLTRLPVVDRAAPRKVLGMISLSDLLKARTRNLEAERRRERVLPLRMVLPLSSLRTNTTDSVGKR
jgi:chloride channel protein, CIC family